MAKMTEADDFFTRGCGRCARFDTPDCAVRLWREGLNDLRRICARTGLEETVKWAHPTYMHAGRNIAMLGAFRRDFRLNFLNPGLLRDTEGVLQRQGPGSAAAGTMRFTAAPQVAAMEPVIRDYLRQLMDHAEAGTRPPKGDDAAEMADATPEELRAALDADPDLAAAFQALTPGRRKSYVLNLATARHSATRIARIRKFRDRIIAGKGATERWP